MSTSRARSSDQAAFERLREDLQSLHDLPSPPRVLDAILSVLAEEGSSAQLLSETVEQDSALAAKLLRLANSAYFGLAQPVGEVRGACVVLGFEMVRALAVGVSTLNALSTSVRHALDLDAFWRHSVGVGTAARLLAKRSSPRTAGVVFCGGILHDLGKLVLATLYGAEYSLVVSREPNLPLRERETARFGGDHAQVGAWLAERWHFPAELTGAIAHHHEPWKAEKVPESGALIHVANWIARRGGCPSEPDATTEVPDAPDPRASEILALPEAVVRDVAEAFGDELQSVRDFVDLARG